MGKKGVRGEWIERLYVSIEMMKKTMTLQRQVSTLEICKKVDTSFNLYGHSVSFGIDEVLKEWWPPYVILEKNGWDCDLVVQYLNRFLFYKNVSVEISFYECAKHPNCLKIKRTPCVWIRSSFQAWVSFKCKVPKFLYWT